MEIEITNPGRIIQGHVLDCRIEPLLKTCQDIEPRLYFKWNPEKQNGRGMWELRIRPTHKKGLYQGMWNGMPIFVLGYKENQFECHIKDFATLNYSIVGWLRKHDTYQHYNYADKLDTDLIKYREKVERIQAEDKKAYFREHKKYFRELKEEATSGRVHWAKLLSEADDDDRNW